MIIAQVFTFNNIIFHRNIYLVCRWCQLHWYYPKLASFLLLLKETKFIPKKNQEAKIGYLYVIKMYEEEKEVGSFTTFAFDNYVNTKVPQLNNLEDF
ncbi:hypothetical protein COJ50_24900 [Bacillus cereus]|uniref:Uncharacterized protein n=1 Tax=Bacillus cereus TaxID=1396 RepID=A0A2B1K2D9_BACCE|nr:hypothetical protein COJ50_24900 [Bacillus cereus]